MQGQVLVWGFVQTRNREEGGAEDGWSSRCWDVGIRWRARSRAQANGEGKRLVAGLEGFESCHERGKVGREGSDAEFSRNGGFGQRDS